MIFFKVGTKLWENLENLSLNQKLKYTISSCDKFKYSTIPLTFLIEVKSTDQILIPKGSSTHQLICL